MLDLIARFFLFFSDLQCILIFFFIGLISDKRRIFYWGGLFCLLSICINYVLKISFKVPLPPELHEGYAFPSGHMQMLTVFYGWLAAHHLMRMRLFFIPLIIGEIFGLTHFHYHTLLEAIAGLITGLFLLSFFKKIYQKSPLLRYFYLVSTLILCLIYIHIFGSMQPYILNAAILLMFFTIIGLMLSLIVRKSSLPKQKN